MPKAFFEYTLTEWLKLYNICYVDILSQLRLCTYVAIFVVVNIIIIIQSFQLVGLFVSNLQFLIL